MIKSFLSPNRLFLAAPFAFVLVLSTALLVLTSYAAPGQPVPYPAPNSHSATLTTTVSISYDEPISPTMVTSRTFVVHAMQSGLVTGTYGVHGTTIVLTPTHPFHQGELVYAIATTGTLGLDGSPPLTATQWQFNAGQVEPCAGHFVDAHAGLRDVWWSSVAWGDYDGDGDLDLLLAGLTAAGVPLARIYRNEGAGAGWAFTEVDHRAGRRVQQLGRLGRL